MPATPSGQPERIYRTGRNQLSIDGMIVGAVWLAFGLALLVLTWRDEKENLGPLALVLAVFIPGGGWMFGGCLLVFLREALAIYPEGLLVANWSGRRTLIPWSDLDGMVMASRAGPWVSTGPWASIAAPSASALTLYLLVKAPSGETTRLEVARIESQATATEITSALAERAGLTYVGDQQQGLSADEVAWHRQPTVSAEPAHEQSGAAEPGVVHGEMPAIHDTAAETAETAPAVASAKPHGPPERVFHTGRTTTIQSAIFFPWILVFFGAAFLFPAWAGEGTAEQIPSLKHLVEFTVMTALGWPMAVAGIGISVICTINYLGSALVVYLDGVMFRNWVGRRRFIPWSDLEGMIVSYQITSGAYGTPYVTLFLMLRLADGSTRRLKVSLARRWEPMYTDITSTLAQRADLAYLGRSEGREVWRRKKNDSGAT